MVFGGGGIANALPGAVLPDFGARTFHESRHTSDLRPRNRTWLHIDWMQMGLGGIDSWGAHESPMRKYTIPYEGEGAVLRLRFGLAAFEPSNEVGVNGAVARDRARALRDAMRAASGSAASRSSA